MNAEKCELQNAIRINHRGFLPYAQKRFVLVENPRECLDFTVIHIDDVKYIKVFEGKLEKVSEDGSTYYVGDFSHITKNGDYYIEAGGFKSRQFVIYDKAYDICQRIMLQYFTLQRCGHPLGWNGPCHLDDGYIKETGERVDLSGGYHQSCDLRKSPGGVSIGVLGMMNFALADKSEWGKILVKDEVRWACDYFVKTIQKNGAMYNTLNLPHGWEGREFYQSPAPSSAQWNVTSILALGYLYFKGTNKTLAKKYLSSALRSWKFMKSEERPTDVYKHPDKYPMGMDPDFFYAQCKKGETSDIAYEISVSANLYRATGENMFLENIKSILPSFIESITDGFILLRKDDPTRIVTGICSYSWLMSGILALCDAYELLGDLYNLKSLMENALNEVCKFADKSVWRKVELLYSEGDMDAQTEHENKTLRHYMKDAKKYKSYYYQQDKVIEPTHYGYLGIFLCRGARLLSKPEYLRYAQSIVDIFLGGNKLDSSCLHGVGYNHPQHSAFGQFFPSTPFIPGAIGIGYDTIDTYKSSAEFDMPCVGIFMNLLSLL